MGQRSQISARTHRSSRRDLRIDTSVQEGDKKLNHLYPHARMPACKTRRQQKHHRARHLFAEGFAHACRVTAQQIVLKIDKLFLGNTHTTQMPESGCDPIDLAPLSSDSVDDRASRANALKRTTTRRYLGAMTGNGNDLRDREGLPIKCDV